MSELNMQHFEGLRQRINQRLHELGAPYADLQIEEYPWLYGALGEVPSKVMFICENPSLNGIRSAAIDTIDGRAPDIEAQWWGGWGNPAAKRFRVALRRSGLKTNNIASRGGWKCYITNVVKEANVAGADQDTKDQRDRKAQARDWADILRWEIGVVRPGTVFCVGRDAMAAVKHLQGRGLLPDFQPRYLTHYSARGSEERIMEKILGELKAGLGASGPHRRAAAAPPAGPEPVPTLRTEAPRPVTPQPPADEPSLTESASDDSPASELQRLEVEAKQRGLVMPAVVTEDELRAMLAELPPPISSRSRYAGKRIVRAAEYQDGSNPRQEGSHGYHAYELIPTDDFGILFEDLMARIRQLPAKSSKSYGAGGANHIKWDLDHEFTRLIEDRRLPVPE